MFTFVLPFISIGLATVAAIKDFQWLEREKSLEGEDAKFPELVRQCVFAQYGNLAKLLINGALGIAIILGLWQRGWAGPLFFVFGALSGFFAGYASIFVGTRASSKVTRAIADKNPDMGFRIAFTAGGITGKAVVACTLLGVTIISLLFQDPEARKVALTAYSLGFSLYALLARVGGGIYTKTADIAADLVGKVIYELEEDSSENPGKVVDCSGDQVGDNAGILADIGDSLTAILVSLSLLLITFLPEYQYLALHICSLGLISTIAATYLASWTRKIAFLKKRISDKEAVFLSFVSAILGFLALYLLFSWLGSDLALFWPSATGSLVLLIIIIVNRGVTDDQGKPVEDVAKAATKGPAFVSLRGLAYGLHSPVKPYITVCLATFVVTIVSTYFQLPWQIGISLSALTILSIGGIVVTEDVFGPICDNAASFATELGDEVRKGCDRLDAVGNANKAGTKIMAVCAATMTIISLLYSFASTASIDINNLHLGRADVLISILMGVVFPFKFSALLLDSVVEGAELLTEEIKGQIERVRNGFQKEPDYLACVDVASNKAFSSLAAPAIYAILAPIALFLILGKYSLGGFILGTLASSGTLAIFFASSGAIWDNAKKRVEGGFLQLSGEEYTLAHTASVSGDLIGDAFKDVLGISLETLATVIAITAITLVSVSPFG